MEITGDILQYIPQRPPFVMIDKLLEVGDETTVTELTVAADNLFCANGYFYEGGMIENIAQSVAAGAGYRYRQQNKIPPAGMIGTIKNLTIKKRPACGTILRTKVQLVTSFENAMVIEGTIFEGPTAIAQCRMNIFVFAH